MKKDRYLYPAIFDYNDDGISVTFPDLPGCITFGMNEDETVSMAKEALALHLYGIEEDQETIPAVTSSKEINISDNQTIVLIEVWMPPFRYEMDNQAVKKTLTIPRWLDDAAKEHKINYSHLLQEAIREHLGIYKTK
ncbi:type II toxin-antitoxin system HicB family antitoxin [Lentibacillus salinarum]|uniref:Type II toxin-antitoxin system HicB family antitoxin n=1 Tax=Lentibacillus salinarum TaxID=446820 RepID=A0ABW3ZTQ8_9BACI